MMVPYIKKSKLLLGRACLAFENQDILCYINLEKNTTFSFFEALLKVHRRLEELRKNWGASIEVEKVLRMRFEPE